ncbi:hypothetical protein Tco_0190715, partial [Tanacetum coccineum]
LICFFNREGKDTLEDLEGWYTVGDWGVSLPCVVVSSSPSGLSSSIILSVLSTVVALGGVGQISRESTMFPVCSAGRTIGFWKLAEFRVECSRRLLREDDGLGPELAKDEASSSKRFLPAIAKDPFHCCRQATFLRLCSSLSGSSRGSVSFLTVLRVMVGIFRERITNEGDKEKDRLQES